jgi:hypothetical protein
MICEEQIELDFIDIILSYTNNKLSVKITDKNLTEKMIIMIDLSFDSFENDQKDQNSLARR